MAAISALVFPKGAPESLLNIYAIAENMNRGPNPADEAERILKVMSYYDWSAEEAARQLSVPVAHIRQRLKLAQLIPEFFDMLKKGKLRVSMALRISLAPEGKPEEAPRRGEAHPRQDREGVPLLQARYASRR